MFCMPPEETEEYEHVLDELEEEVEKTEKEFGGLKDDDIDPEKKELAENLINEIHEQIGFLEEQLERIREEKD